MRVNKKAVLYEVLRRHLPSFVRYVFEVTSPGEQYVDNWHIEALCHALMRIYRQQSRRLIIEMPPRSLKSITVSVAYTAFLLGLDPTRKIICVSYSSELAAQLSRACRMVMKHPIYRQIFPETEIDANKDREDYFRTTAGGYRYATSVGGTLTGIGASLIILDDPLKAEDAYSLVEREAVNRWFDTTLRSRLNNKAKDAIVVVMQRLHAEDLSGHLRRQGGWEVLSLPAIAEVEEEVPIGPGEYHHRAVGDLLDPIRYSQEVLDEEKAVSSAAFLAQYQQQPVPPDGEMIKWAWMGRFSEVLMPPYSRIVQSWDTAIKPTGTADYSVCLTFAVLKKKYYLLDILRERLDFPSLRRAVLQQAYMWKAEDILIEDQGAGSSLIQQLRDDQVRGLPLPIGIKPELDKVTRLWTVSPLLEQGRLFVPETAPWLDEFRLELLQFPHGRHDDQVDALSQFLGWVATREARRHSIEVVPMFAKRPKRPREWTW